MPTYPHGWIKHPMLIYIKYEGFFLNSFKFVLPVLLCTEEPSITTPQLLCNKQTMAVYCTPFVLKGRCYNTNCTFYINKEVLCELLKVKTISIHGWQPLIQVPPLVCDSLSGNNMLKMPQVVAYTMLTSSCAIPLNPNFLYPLSYGHV